MENLYNQRNHGYCGKSECNTRNIPPVDTYFFTLVCVTVTVTATALSVIELILRYFVCVNILLFHNFIILIVLIC